MQTHLTYAEQQAANKKDKKHGIINTIFAIAMGVPLFIMVMNDLCR